jgi:hypothetical protein
MNTGFDTIIGRDDAQPDDNASSNNQLDNRPIDIRKARAEEMLAPEGQDRAGNVATILKRVKTSFTSVDQTVARRTLQRPWAWGLSE